MNISRFYITIFIIVVITAASVIVDYVYGHWQSLLIATIAVFTWIGLHFLHVCVDRHIPSKTGKKLNHVPGVNVNVHCTRYIFGTEPFFIDFCDVCVAKIYRGNDLVISIPEGVQNIRVYRDSSEKFDNEVTISEKCDLYLTSDNASDPKYYISDHVDEQKEIKTYEEKLSDEIYDALGDAMNQVYIFLSVLSAIGITIEIIMFLM